MREPRLPRIGVSFSGSLSGTASSSPPPPPPVAPRSPAHAGMRRPIWAMGRIFHTYRAFCVRWLLRQVGEIACQQGAAHPCEMEAVEEGFSSPFAGKGRIPPPRRCVIPLLCLSSTRVVDEMMIIFLVFQRENGTRGARNLRATAPQTSFTSCTSSYVCVPHSTAWPATRE